MTRERVAYLHLPKAAGTSVRVVFGERFDADETAPWAFDPLVFWPDDVPARLTRAVFLGDPSELRAYRYLEGHWALSTIRHAFDDDDIACVLREPRARLLSHYSFWRSWDAEMFERWHPYAAPHTAQAPLSEFLAAPDAAHQTDNLLCRLLLAPHPLIDPANHIAVEHVEELTQLATRCLDELGHVDLVERGDEMRGDLGAWADIELPERRSNVTDLSAGPPVDLDDLASAAASELLHDRTEIDRRLWRHVARRHGWGDADIDRAAGAAFAASVARIGAATARRCADEVTELRTQVTQFENARLVRLATPLWRAKARLAARLR